MDMTFEYKWNQVNTKILIEYYAKYISKVGTVEIKNKAALWEKIAEDFLKFDIKVSGNNCQNRWKVLERNYKKVIDNQNKTGRGRKYFYFEYEKEMREVVGERINVHPEILLSTETEDHIDIPEEDIGSVDSEQIENDTESKNIEFPTRKQRVVKNKLTTLQKLRLDRKAYYDERLKIEKEKIEVMKKRNEILAERNEILKGKRLKRIYMYDS